MITNYEVYEKFSKTRTKKERELMEPIIKFIDKIPQKILIWEAKEGKSDKTYDLAFKAFGKKGSQQGGPNLMAFILYSEKSRINPNRERDSLQVQFRFKKIGKRYGTLSEMNNYDPKNRCDLVIASQDW